MSEVIVRAGDILASIKIKVTGLEAARRRVRLAIWLMGFIELISGCAIEIAVDDRRCPEE